MLASARALRPPWPRPLAGSPLPRSPARSSPSRKVHADAILARVATWQCPRCCDVARCPRRTVTGMTTVLAHIRVYMTYSKDGPEPANQDQGPAAAYQTSVSPPAAHMLQ